MKIAIAIDGNMCSEHFGRCGYFKIYEIKDNKDKAEETPENTSNNRPLGSGLGRRNGRGFRNNRGR